MLEGLATTTHQHRIIDAASRAFEQQHSRCCQSFAGRRCTGSLRRLSERMLIRIVG